MTDHVVRHVRPGPGPGTLLEITPPSVGWRYLSFRVIRLGPGETIDADTADQEAAIVPLEGSGSFTFDGATHPVARRDVFSAKPHVAYLPPRTGYTIESRDGLEIAIGSAPAEGRYPARWYTPDDLPSFVRGGANVERGVTATVDPTFSSERLIAYEILTPSGNWSSFPPHRHDGRFGTSYHEETYYYRLTPDDGFAIQRLYTRDTDLDTSIAAANAYYLNFLAGDTKPVTQLNDPAYAWVADDWTGRPISIPLEPTA